MHFGWRKPGRCNCEFRCRAGERCGIPTLRNRRERMGRPRFCESRQTEGKRGAGKNRKGAYSQCCRKSGNLLTASAKW